MNANMQEFPKDCHVTKNTGFPEPLNLDRNTTLTHPEADTSRGCTIEGAAVPPSHPHFHISFLGRNHSNKRSKVEVNGVPKSLYSDIQYADGSREVKSPKELAMETQRRGDIVDPPSVELDGVLQRDERDVEGQTIRDKRRGVLRKLNLHKV